MDVFKNIIYYCEFHLLLNDEYSSEIDNKNEADNNNSMEVLEIIPLRDEVNKTKKDDTNSEVIKASFLISTTISPK